QDPPRLGLQRRQLDPGLQHGLVPEPRGLGLDDQHGRQRPAAARLRRPGGRAHGRQAHHQLCQQLGRLRRHQGLHQRLRRHPPDLVHQHGRPGPVPPLRPG
ncbi:hypothetical protein BN1708_017851, partial [Verticillium longisporum]